MTTTQHITASRRRFDSQLGRYVEETADVTVQLEISLDNIFKILGSKAWRNKSKVAKEMGGLIMARII